MHASRTSESGGSICVYLTKKGKRNIKFSRIVFLREVIEFFFFSIVLRFRLFYADVGETDEDIIAFLFFDCSAFACINQTLELTPLMYSICQKYLISEKFSPTDRIYNFINSRFCYRKFKQPWWIKSQIFYTVFTHVIYEYEYEYLILYV